MKNLSLNSILYIGEHLDTQSVVKMVLRVMGGFTVRTCGSVRTALAIEQEFFPDLILLDANLEEKELTIWDDLHRFRLNTTVPVMLMAYKEDQKDIGYYRAHGVLGVIAKPFAPLQLTEQVQRLWKQHQTLLHDTHPDAVEPNQLQRQPVEVGRIQQNEMATSPISFSHLRVLILEDDQLQREFLRLLLNAFGISSIMEAADGSSGLRLLEAADHEFDLVFCDLNMGDMDGMDGIEFIRHASSRKIPAVILMSALDGELLTSAENLARGYKLPLLGILEKPLVKQKLEELLVHCINKGAPSIADEENITPHEWTKMELMHALYHEQFLPFFQPKFDLETNRLQGVEILARWDHPTLGILPPAQFIKLMEKEGLIDQLTEAIFRQALRSARQWADDGWSVNLAINMSPSTLQNTEMSNSILLMLNEYGIPPNQITIEVTETAFSQDPRGLLETVMRLRMYGFKISIDDFGVGYSSLQQLSDIPFTELKIDRSFVAGMSHSQKSLAIFESIMQLSGKLGLRTVAEGIETQEEYDLLRSLGCEVGQGFFFAKPMSVSDFQHWRDEGQ